MAVLSWCIVVAVVVREPQGERYYASQVAAPVFARVMSHILRLNHVSPDALDVSSKAHNVSVST